MSLVKIAIYKFSTPSILRDTLGRVDGTLAVRKPLSRCGEVWYRTCLGRKGPQVRILPPRPILSVWCNGSTTVSKTVCQGSSPCTGANSKGNKMFDIIVDFFATLWYTDNRGGDLATHRKHTSLYEDLCM